MRDIRLVTITYATGISNRGVRGAKAGFARRRGGYIPQGSTPALRRGSPAALDGKRPDSFDASLGARGAGSGAASPPACSRGRNPGAAAAVIDEKISPDWIDQCLAASQPCSAEWLPCRLGAQQVIQCCDGRDDEHGSTTHPISAQRNDLHTAGEASLL